MRESTLSFLRQELAALKSAGLYKEERIITSPQGAELSLKNGKKVLNFCANNYLGLANHPEIVKAAKEALDTYGFGMASVRFICGTQEIHKELEKKLAAFLGTEDAILYSSCFDANGGLFETLLSDKDAVISDQLNHASIIDGIRLCKAKRLRYANNNMEELEARLKESQEDRFRMIATDGVFSMDGIIANLSEICSLAAKYDASVMVDDCHATGFLGQKGRGTPEHCGVLGKVDILTGTLGKTLGGASGGYIAGRQEVIDWLRQKSRPYLFSNTLSPSLVIAGIKALEIVSSEEGDRLRAQLQANKERFRQKMGALGFTLVPGEHPIIPVMLKEAPLAQEFAKRMLQEGVYVVGFFFPVVPQGQARIRTQMSAAHSAADIDQAVDAFAKVGRELGVI